MTTDFTVELALPRKAVLYREVDRNYAFELEIHGSQLEVDFGHCYDPTSFGGGAYSYGETTTEEQRRIVPRIIEWLQSAGYTVEAAGQHDERWCPSYYKK